MTYYSPENFDTRDGDHDHPLRADWRTPKIAAMLTLALKDAPGYVRGIQTPDGELHVRTDQPQSPVFAAYLRRERVIVYEPGMLQE